MKCLICDGKGKLPYRNPKSPYHEVLYMEDCYACGGTGVREKREQTNEEWIKSCSTEELVKFLVAIIIGGFLNFPHSTDPYEFIRKWLKEAHKND